MAYIFPEMHNKSYPFREEKSNAMETVCNVCTMIISYTQVNVTPDDSSAEMLSGWFCVELVYSGGRLTDGGSIAGILDCDRRLLPHELTQPS